MKPNKKLNSMFKAEKNIARRVDADNKAKHFADYAAR